MTERITDVPDIEAPAPDVFEQSLPVADPEDDVVQLDELLAGDLEVPESDAIEQHQPALDPYDEDWR